MKIDLNEKETLKRYLEEGCDGENKGKVFRLLAKQCYFSSMNKIQTKEYIVNYMDKKSKFFNLLKYEKLLDTTIDSQFKYKNEFIDVKEIYITKKELEIISSINNIKLEQLAFTYLVYAKVFNKIKKNNNGWVNTKQSEIFKDAKITKTVKEQNFMIRDLMELNILKDAYRNDNLSKQVLIIDDESETEIVINKFKDEDNFVYYYLKWKGEKIINCSECGKMIKPTGKNHKMCKECWRESEKERQRIKWHKNKYKYKK